MKPVIALHDLQFGYGASALYPAFSFACHAGACVALLGRNGAGKSALLKTLLGALPPVAGTVSFAQAERSTRAAQVAYLPQRAIVPEGMTVNELLALGAYRFLNAHMQGEAPRAADVLAQLGLGDFGDRLVAQCSGGEQQRIMLGRALMQNARVILCDEPAAHLDPGQRAALIAQFARICASGTTIIFSTHFAEDARASAQHTMLFMRERVQALPTADVSDDMLRALYEPT